MNYLIAIYDFYPPKNGGETLLEDFSGFVAENGMQVYGNKPRGYKVWLEEYKSNKKQE